MAFQNKVSRVGITFTKDRLKLVEVESVGGQYQINKILQQKASVALELPKDPDHIHATIDGISNYLNEILTGAGIQNMPAAFILDSQMVLIKKIPTDQDLVGEELRNHVRWEAEQLVSHPLDEYILDYNHLTRHGQRNHSELLIVVVRKAVIDMVREIFRRTSLNLQVIDVDLFAAMRVIKANYDYAENEYIGLIDVSQNQAKISVMVQNDYFLSTDFLFATDQSGRSSPTSPDDEQLTKIISKELRRVVLDHKIGKNIEDLQQLFLYGEMVRPHLIENLQTLYDIRISKVNPFRKVRFSAAEINEVEDNLIRNFPETFAVCIGAALHHP
ncbi:pilus assembly protein PilM [candidate division KSB1 bacterium]|nr:pilus assembly protein PilM [candidate division KSB1 bacterium]